MKGVPNLNTEHHFFRLYTLVRSAAPDNSSSPFFFEIFASFLLVDNKTKKLTVTHGYRHTSDAVELGVKEHSDLTYEVSNNSHLKNIAQDLLAGTFINRFEGIFRDSSRSILRLLQVVVCCDKLDLNKSWSSKRKTHQSALSQKGK